MINVNVEIITPIIDFRAEVDKILNKEVYPLLRNTANQLLDEHLRKYGDTPYSITVDGRNAPNRSAISTAKKRVTIHFIQEAVRVGLMEMTRMMRKNISNFASPRGWIQKDQIATQEIKIFYYSRETNTSSPISNSSEITNFRPGDKIYMVPMFGTQQYSNVKNPDPDKRLSQTWGGAKGWMGKTAANIRGVLKIGKKNSPIRVIAGRSRRALDYIPLVKRPGGKYIQRTAEDARRGAWVIIIEYANIRV
jgi:hypothetical protein